MANAAVLPLSPERLAAKRVLVTGVSAAEGQRGLLDGVRDPRRGHVAQAGDNVAEPILAVDVMVNMAAGLGHAVGKQHQAVSGPQQPS